MAMQIKLSPRPLKATTPPTESIPNANFLIKPSVLIPVLNSTISGKNIINA